jgi:CheY-like chemotaxis protein
MAEPSRILIADDDVKLSGVIARVLANEGYLCECTSDGQTAERRLSEENYDLLISDIEMPGNSRLELIRNLSKLAPGLPVILMTGYPTVATATEFVQLPIFAYLLKPVDFGALIQHIRNAIARHQLYRAVRASETRLVDWTNNLGELKGSVESYHSGSLDMGLSTFLKLTFNNMMGAFGELRTLMEVAQLGAKSAGPCQILQCPLKQQFEQAMEGAITVMKDTKGSFKSKEIAEIRKNFEQILLEQRRKSGPAENSISPLNSR